jgi:hypothetical protein
MALIMNSLNMVVVENNSMLGFVVVKQTQSHMVKWNDFEVLSNSMFKWTNRLTNLGIYFSNSMAYQVCK